ncbi:YmfQ family protein [Cytobacillus oceanisediminis]|uniref:Phage portal protein n=1 Tax=Cytobacillus oceanisediminis 2691 TaxID=1196031 RepID=A0A160MA58_9BACI|nr:YmfQ family protein [Cytobacillus oceanisediminis]AND39627.1 phage portal protein [Cytobacillus oceanisediminis 2691]
MKFLGTELTRNIERDMFDYMPKEYEDYRESRAIIQSEAAEFESLNAQITDVLAQFFIDTATWGLANWEQLVDVPTDPTKPLNQRRSVIKSKLRGIGTVSVSLIKNVAESYANGEVDVVEESANFTIRIKFVSTLGVPENLADIQKAITDIIPAHLAINFEFTYVLYSQLEAKYADYNAVVASGLTYEQILTDGGA